MKMTLKVMAAVAAFSLAAGVTNADISINAVTDVYTQDFNSLPTQDAGTFTWTDNSTLNGWYRRANVNNTDQTPDPDLVDYAVKGANVGVPGFYNVSTLGNPDRAVGFRINGAPSGLKKGSLGLIFENNTGTTLTGFDVAYQGEQWFQSVNDTTLVYQWRVVDSFADINNDIDRAQAGWSNESSPLAWFVAGGSANAWMNGLQNSTSISGSVSGMSLAPGQKLVMRWRIPLAGAQRAGLFIDDVQVNNWVAIPEPGTLGLMMILGTSAIFIRRWMR
jgi:hypothetical protein